MPGKTFFVILFLVLWLAACGDEEPTPTPLPATTPHVPVTPPQPTPTASPTPEPTLTAVPTSEPTPTPPDSLIDQISHMADPQLVNVLWQWERRDPNGNGSAAINVPNPEAYTLFFQENGAFQATIDCNEAHGRYATNTPGSIFMEAAVSTLAACGPNSLAEQMILMFGPVQSYRFEEGGRVLAFQWAAGGPVDYFLNAAALEPSQTAAGQALVEAIPPDTISLSLGELADSYDWSVQPGYPVAPEPGGFGLPPHILVTFDGETAADVSENNGRRLYIFPRQAYENLVGEPAGSQVMRLNTLIAQAENRQTVPDNPLPLLPPPPSFMNRWAQFLDLDFGVGQGVRYVSDAPNRPAVGPWTNETTTYYYQGLTGDGDFYISFVWPVSTTVLPDSEAVVDEAVATEAGNPDTYSVYLQRTKETLNGVPAAAWSPSLTDLDALIRSLTFPTGAEQALSGDVWEWVSITDPVRQTNIETPERYTIAFQEDGTAVIQADCNQVNAAYSVDGRQIGIVLGPSQLAACAADSLDQQFLAGLEAAAIYFFQQDALFLDLFADGGTLKFKRQGQRQPPPPAEGETVGAVVTATGTIAAPDGVFVRTGPGSDYPPVAALAFGEPVTIVGRSEDNQWWVIEWPFSVETPYRRAWVAAVFVEVTEAAGVPVVAAVALEPTETVTPTVTTEPTATPAAGTDAGEVEGIPFVLVSFGAEGAEQAVLEGTEVTAVFSQTTISGSAGCNSYTGTLRPVNDYFSVSDLVVSQQVCAEPVGIMEQEQAFLEALAGTVGFLWQEQLVDGVTLVIAGQLLYTLADGSRGVMNFMAVP